MFQHTAARRRLQRIWAIIMVGFGVSTHSRAEAAADFPRQHFLLTEVSTHSRAEAAAIGV